MQEFLVFRLYGPMASWGDIAVGEMRASHAYPTKSAIVGLLSAALGLEREDDGSIRTLQNGIRFGVRIDSPGYLFRDYHTAQVPSVNNKALWLTRREELQQDGLNTILSTREYIGDAVYSVVLWASPGHDECFNLATIAEALVKPKFMLYLGRKSCPLGLPLRPQLVRATNMKEALLQSYTLDELLSFLVEDGKPKQVFWETGLPAGFEAVQLVRRRDEVLHRTRWQFAERQENQGWATGDLEAM